MPDDRPVNPVTPADLDALSAYLDNQLPQAERAALESRLAAEPALRAELESLRAVQQALAALPPMRAPRDLTLTPAQAKPVRRVVTFPAFVSGLSAVAAAILLIAGFVTLRPVSAPPVTNVVAAAPTATLTLQPEASPAARVMDTSVPTPEESTGDAAGSAESAPIMQELFSTTEVTEPSLADAAIAAQPPTTLDQQDSTAAESMIAGSAPAAGNAAAALPTGQAELSMQAPVPLATESESARTKEATPTAAPSETLVPTVAPTATLTPTDTPAPTPAPVIAEQTSTSSQPDQSGWLLLALGGLLVVVAVVAGIRARRTR